MLASVPALTLSAAGSAPAEPTSVSSWWGALVDWIGDLLAFPVAGEGETSSATGSPNRTGTTDEDGERGPNIDVNGLN
jgi:hypothetical protein